MGYCLVHFVMSDIRCDSRLSYHQRISNMMPETYKSLIPPPCAPTYKYSSEGAGEEFIFIFMIFIIFESVIRTRNCSAYLLFHPTKYSHIFPSLLYI